MNVGRFLYISALFGAMLDGCAAHRVGLVDTSGPSVALKSPDGSRERLLLTGEATALRYLGDHLVEIDGRKGLGRIEISSFRVIEGPHGLPVWVGPVQVLGLKVSIADEASGMLVFVDSDAARAMSKLPGRWVAAEGYVDGPQQVVVLHWRELSD